MVLEANLLCSTTIHAFEMPNEENALEKWPKTIVNVRMVSSLTRKENDTLKWSICCNWTFL